MKTPMEQTTLLWHIINDSPLSGIVSGGIYQLQRPVNSKKEDIVVNAITIDGEVIQTGIANVNIHVPNLTDKTPDTARLQELGQVAKEIIKEGFSQDYTFWIEDQAVLQDVNDWFINFRLRFRHHPINN